MKWVLKNTLYTAWVLCLFGMLMSLFISEVERIEPCHLCWYQRIALFPLVLLLGMATYKNNLAIVSYAMPLVVIGGLIAFYQTLGQKLPFLLSNATCGFADECVGSNLSLFGFISFPFISALGFTAIGLLLYVAKKKNPTNGAGREP
jgi:disulfide bond formation protein DsbB